MLTKEQADQLLDLIQAYRKAEVAETEVRLVRSLVSNYTSPVSQDAIYTEWISVADASQKALKAVIKYVDEVTAK